MTRLYTARGGQQMALFPGAKPPRLSAANRGMEFENELKVMHAVYKKQGRARIEKNFVPSQPVNNGQWAKVIGKAIVDFTGLTAGGRFVAFDAKDCVESRIELNRLYSHQIEYLGDVFALGGAAFILVRFKSRFVYKIPVDCWADAEIFHKWGKPVDRVDNWKPRNRASLSMSDMKPEWAVNGVDWLGVTNG